MLTGCAYLTVPETLPFCLQGKETFSETMFYQIHFHSTSLLLAFDYLHILAGLFIKFEYRVFHFKKLLSMDFGRENFVFFIGIAEIIAFHISVSWFPDKLSYPEAELPFLLAFDFGKKLRRYTWFYWGWP